MEAARIIDTHPMYYQAPCVGDRRFQDMIEMDFDRRNGGRYRLMNDEQARLYDELAVVCASCDFRTDCERLGKEQGLVYGVWGGQRAEDLYANRNKKAKRFKRVRVV